MTQLASGKQVASEVVLYAAGRQGETEDLELERAGLEADERGRIAVGPDYRTAVEHIFAAGDVVGWPALAATSMEQGRVAAAHAFGEEASMSEVLPIGIYTIPEIRLRRSHGRGTDGEQRCLTRSASRAIASFARGYILGDMHGLLKLLVSREDHTILGVHVLGTNATELIHIGQTVMGLGGTIDYLIDAVFNYPTLAESYKVAALDARNRLMAVERIVLVGRSQSGVDRQGCWTRIARIEACIEGGLGAVKRHPTLRWASDVFSPQCTPRVRARAEK